MINNNLESNIYTKHLKEMIKKLVSKSGKTTTEIAEKIGMKQPNFSKCINDENRNFSIEQICNLSKYFGVSTDELLGINCTHDSRDKLLIESKIKANIKKLMDNTACCHQIKGSSVKGQLLPTLPTFFEISLNSFDNNDLASIIGMNEEDVYKCLKIGENTKFFTLEQILKIADYFEVSLDYLCGRKVRSNFEICEFLAILFKNCKINLTEHSVKMLKPHNLDSKELYKIATNLKQRNQLGIIEGRLDTSINLNYDNVNHNLLYFPQFDETESVINYTKEESGNLIPDNVIINNFIKRLFHACRQLEDGIIDEEDFDDRIDTALNKVFKIFQKCATKTNINEQNNQ